MVKLLFEIPNCYEGLEQHKKKRRQQLTDSSEIKDYEDNVYLLKNKLGKLKEK